MVSTSGFLFRYLCCFLILVVSTNLLIAQNYTLNVQHLSVEDGLSNRFVNEILKDSKGMIWVATEGGLNRYDGYEFIAFTQENSDLSGNSIQAIHEDKKQRLWLTVRVDADLQSVKNINLFHLETHEINSFDEAFEGIAPFENREIEGVYSDHNKNLWIHTKAAVYNFDGEVFTKFYAEVNNRFMSIFHVDDQFVWLWIEQREILRIDRESRQERSFTYNDLIGRCGADANDNLWLFLYREEAPLRKLSPKGKLKTIDLSAIRFPDTLKRYNEHNRFILSPYGNTLWFRDNEADQQHLILLEDQISYDLNAEFNSCKTYQNINFSSFYFETPNKTWVATHDGFYIVKHTQSPFSQEIAEATRTYSIRGIVKGTDGTLHVNTHQGRIQLKNNEASEPAIPVWMGIAEDSSGNIWNAQHAHGVEKLEPNSGEYEFYGYPKHTPGEPWEQWGIMASSNGTIWVGAKTGIYFLNTANSKYQKFERYNSFTQLKESIVYHFYEDHEGIWLASSTGVYLLDMERGIVARLGTQEPGINNLPFDHILHFHKDSEGVFWLATKGRGLIRFESVTGKFEQFTLKDGLSSDIIYAVYEDDFGYLWMSSNYGLMRMNKATRQVKVFLEEDGITHNEFNTISHYQDKQGTLYFGGLAGVTAFHPKDFIDTNVYSVPLQLTQCRVLNSTSGTLTDELQAVVQEGKLILRPEQNSVILHYALLSHEDQKRNSYAYKIEGLDDHWINLRENNVRLNGLPYGDFVLRVKGRGAEGEWSDQQLKLPIEVLRPFYLEANFIIACIVAFGMLLYGLFRWRVRSLKAAKIQLEQSVSQRTREIRQQKETIEEDKRTIEAQATRLLRLDQVKSRFFANISHELRTPITLISGHIDELIKSSGTNEEMARHLHISQQNGKRLQSLVEEVLDLSKLESGQLKLHEKPVQFYPLVSRLFDMFHSFCAQKNLDFSLDYRLPKELTVQLDESKLEKIVCNLLSNATKFSGPGESVQFIVDTSDQQESNVSSVHVNITVVDTGRGIPPEDLPHIFERFYQTETPGIPAEGGTGIGLALVKELATLMKGTIHVESTWKQGSSFCFSVLLQIVAESDVANARGGALTEQALTPTVGIAHELPNVRDSDKNLTDAQLPRILIVEDHPEMRSFIYELLREHYRIWQAIDGVDALKKLSKYKVDLIISDVMMPRMDGFELLQKVKKEKQFGDLPMILLTARAAHEDKIEALRVGVDDYLTKPFHAEELRTRVANLLRNQQEREEWIKQAEEKSEIASIVPQDQLFINEVTAIVKQELSNPKLSVMDLTDGLLVSEAQLFRKMKSYCGLSPNQFIREMRLQEARKLLESQAKNTVSEVMYAVGFQQTGYFAKRYSERFGKKPSTYF